MAKSVNPEKIREIEETKQNIQTVEQNLETLTKILTKKEQELKEKRQRLIEEGDNPIKANRKTSDLFQEVKEMRDDVKKLRRQLDSLKGKLTFLEKWSDSVRFYLTFKNLYKRNNSFWKLKRLLGLDGNTIYTDIFVVYMDAHVEVIGDLKTFVQNWLYINWNPDTFLKIQKELEQKYKELEQNAGIDENEGITQEQHEELLGELKEYVKTKYVKKESN